MSDTMDCPRCHKQAEVVKEEVDIGVGVQEHLIGVDCPHCNQQTTACNGCGCWLELQEHRTGAANEEECIEYLSSSSDEVPFP